MQECSARTVAIFCFFLSSGAVAQCDSGAVARIEAEKIEPKPISSVVAHSSSGATFIINSDSNQISITISDISAAFVRDFTLRYAKCKVSVSIKGIILERESVSNLFPLSGEGGFTKYFGLTIPKENYPLKYLEQIALGEKIVTLKVE